MLKLPRVDAKKGQSQRIRSIAVMTSGGDAPGMNAAIRSVVRYAATQNLKTYGIRRGYEGLLDNQFYPMTLSSVANIIQRGGTLLKTSRCEDFFKKFKKKTCRRNSPHKRGSMP